MILFLVEVKSLIPVNGVLQTEETKVKRPYNIHTVQKITLIPGQDNKLLVNGFLMWPYNSKSLYLNHCVSGVSECVVIKTAAGIKHVTMSTSYETIKHSQFPFLSQTDQNNRTM